jgi:uncharacterized membrane protein
MRTCPSCGGENPGVAAFCGLCGANLAAARPLPPPLPPAAAARLEWITSFPLATSRFILYDLAKVLFWTGSILLCLGSVIALAQGAGHSSASEWLDVIGIFLLVLAGLGLLFLLVMVAVFRNRFRAWFSIGPEGAAYETRSRAAHWSNRAAVVAGILAGSAGTAGAGLLAYSQESDRVSWSGVRRVRLHPRHCVISVMNGWRVLFRFYCTPDNYAEACRLVRLYAPAAVVDGASS